MEIRILDGYALNPGDLSWDGVKAMGNLHVYERTGADEVYERCEGAEIVFTNKTPLTADVLKKLPVLKYIGVLATGYNIVDVDAAKKQGIVVANVPGYGTASVVQMTFSLLLELCLHVQRHSDTVMNGKWAASADWCYWDYPLVELAGKNIGIIGFGNIGKQVATVATAFGMNVLATANHRPEQTRRENFRWVDTEEILESSDVVTIHCPLVPETKGLINAANLRRMKTSSFLINTSRGAIIVDEDLAEALNNGDIAGAGLDVLSVEPPSMDNPLFKAKNCVITPHIAWATREARGRLMKVAEENLLAFLNGNPVNVVNK